jgi:hypothetical protein
VPVIAAALATSSLLVVLVRPDPRFVPFVYGVLGLDVVVGVLGFGFHVAADLERRSLAFPQRFVFGAPAFAPLWFADLAVLAALGRWAGAKREGRP